MAPNIYVQQTYIATVDFLRHRHLIACRCENCDQTYSADKLAPIVDASLTPGDPSPAGRCPECGQLAYVDAPDLTAVVEVLQQLLACPELKQDDLEPHTVVLIESARLLLRGA
jgi:NAD-dependent SIR2 family protein deacetylase